MYCVFGIVQRVIGLLSSLDPKQQSKRTIAARKEPATTIVMQRRGQFSPEIISTSTTPVPGGGFSSSARAPR